MKTLCCVSLLVLCVGCAHKFQIITEPSNADVKLNGEYLGKSPVESNGVCRTFGRRPTVVLTKPGYKETQVSLEYEGNITNIIIDLFVAWPLVFLNAECPKETYMFLLEPNDLSQTSSN